MNLAKHFSCLIFVTFLLFSCTDENPDGLEGQLLTQLSSLTTQTVSGNIKNGEFLETLDWAWNSANACFVETAASRYLGKHIYFQVELPTNSVMTINLKPKDPGAALALYGYSKGTGTITYPEDLTSAVSCEADPSNNNGSQTGDRSIELRAISNPYSVMIGVAGAEGLTDAEFDLEVNIDS